MKLRNLAILIAGLALVSSCGGGSGSDQVGPTTTLSFSFPSPGGEVIGTTLTIRGMTAGPVDLVQVAGLPAVSGDGFGTWSRTLTLPEGANEIEIAAFHAGREVARRITTLTVVDAFSAHMTVSSREEQGVFAYYDALVREVVRVNEATGQRRSVPLAASSSAPLQIQDIEYDPQVDCAYLAAVGLMPELITVDFALGTTSAQPLPGSTIGDVDEFELDAVGRRLFVRVDLDALHTRVYSFDLGTQALSLLSDDSAGGGAFANIETLAFEPISGRLFAHRQWTSEFIEIDLENGDRSLLPISAASGSPGLINPTALSATATSLLAVYHQTTQPPMLFDLQSGSGLTLDLSVLPAPGLIRSSTGGSAAGHRLGDGRRVYVGDPVSGFAPAFSLALGAEDDLTSHPSIVFDAPRRCLILGTAGGLIALDPDQGSARLIADAEPLLSDSTYRFLEHDRVGDRYVFGSGLAATAGAVDYGVFAIAPSGGTRTVLPAPVAFPLQTVIDSQGDLVTIGFDYQFSSQFSLQRFDPSGAPFGSITSPFLPPSSARCAVDLEGRGLFTVGTTFGSGAPLSLRRFDLDTGVQVDISSDAAPGPSLGGFRAATMGDPGEVLVLTGTDLLAIDLSTGLRTSLLDLGPFGPGLVDLAWDDEGRVAYLTGGAFSPVTLALDRESGGMQVLRR